MEIGIVAPEGFYKLTGEFRKVEPGEWAWSGQGKPFLQKTERSMYDNFIVEPVTQKEAALKQYSEWRLVETEPFE